MKVFYSIPLPILVLLNGLCAFYAPPLIANTSLEITTPVLSQENEQAKNEVTPSSSLSDILQNDDPLPINDRILSLLVLQQEKNKNNLDKVKEILAQLKDIDETFNASEHFLMLFIQGLIEHASNNHKETITILEESLTLRVDIPNNQRYLPEFSEVFIILADAYSAEGEYKKAFDSKDKYIGNSYLYFDAVRAGKITELNETYATDHKIKQNELLVNQNKIKRLKIVDAENKKFAQQRNILILVITVIVFLILVFKQIKVRKKLKYLAKTDSLTGLYNRRTLFEQGAKAVQIAKNEKQKLSVILLDIDFFKNVNDTYGHDAGDEIIKIIAKLGSETMRSRDVFARLGGEEFAGILPGVGCDEAKAIAERLREKVANIDLSKLNIKQQLTVSIGVACLEQIEPDFDDLLNAADLAMYYAKANGRNRVCLYNDKIESNND